MLNDQKTYYCSDNRLQVQEIRWFRLKIAGIILGSTVICLAALLAINHFSYDFLGLGYQQYDRAIQENRMLHEQLVSLASHMKDLESSVKNLDQQGNHLRLLVDLQTMDAETKAAGTGGAVTEPEFVGGIDPTTKLFQQATSTLQKLSGQIKVEQQSYEQIVKKYEYNKGYFAAMPALKPMEGYYSVRGFGLRMHPVLGIFKTHQGLDIANDVGTPVVAAADGIVEMAGHSGGGYGIAVVLKHGYGYQTLYAHLSKVMVREGQRVKRGDLIAKSGRTGLVTGPHLHYEVRHNGLYQNPIDFFFDDVSIKEFKEQIASR